MQYREGTLIVVLLKHTMMHLSFRGHYITNSNNALFFLGKSRKANIDLHSLILPQYGEIIS